MFEFSTARPRMSTAPAFNLSGDALQTGIDPKDDVSIEAQQGCESLGVMRMSGWVLPQGS